jgi:hypothetical protein
VAHRAAADVRLGDLGDLDRRLHARVGAELLERVLERERVENGGEHAHVVAGGAVHPGRRARQAAVDVAAADDHRDLHAALLHAPHLLGDRGDALAVGAVLERAHQGLAGQLQEDAVEGGRGSVPRPYLL